MITGINVKQSKGEMLVGIKLDEFIQQLRSLPNKDGWVNLVLSPRKNTHPNGYTHYVNVENRKYGGTKGESILETAE
jgi:hypothetical protein